MDARIEIDDDEPKLQRYVFAPADRSYEVTASIEDILSGGLPEDPDTEEELEWLGVAKPPLLHEPIRIELGGGQHIQLAVSGYDEASLVSNLKDQIEPLTAQDLHYNDAICGMESLIMALACEGFDVAGRRFVRAIKTAMESIADNS